MKITITPSGGQIRVLGDDDAGASIVDDSFNPSGSVRIQTAAYLRGAKVKKFNRGNAELGFSFRVERGHDDFADAGVFVADEIRDVTGMKGTIEITENDGVGGNAKRNTPDAIVSKVIQTYRRGRRSVIEYTIEGGQFASLAPNP